MAEPLKNHFGPVIFQRLADQLREKQRRFPRDRFVAACADGYDVLELLPRARHIADCLQEHLPGEYPEAIELLISTLGPPLEKTENNGMAPFFYLPHVLFVRQFGLDHFEESMQAQYELTQRFSAEFSIRPFLEQRTEETLRRLESWTDDPSVHVRRLVSEGTRPRLPWAGRLRAFQKDPSPVLPLLDRLKDDPEIYVRRSVANHLNDISKDHPDLACDVATRWNKKASANRRWVVRHGLRSLIKQGFPPAFSVLGYAPADSLEVVSLSLEPRKPHIGESAVVSMVLRNDSAAPVSAIVDFGIDYRKANGGSQPKVFKLKNCELAAGEELTLSKTVSFRQMTTRKHYPGEHRLFVLVNGQEAAGRKFAVND